MKTPKLSPVVTPHPNSPVSDTIETHPSYGQIGASRVSGGAVLYGSDFVSQHYVTITISKSELHRGLNNDWPHSREELISVALTEAQWATFVSSMNAGRGVQCTLEHIGCEPIPQIDKPTDRRAQFASELKERFAEATTALNELRAEIDAAKLSEKAKDALRSKLHSAERNITPNLKFVADQFDEHMEASTEKAKIEVASYIEAHIRRAGLSVLQSESAAKIGSGNETA